MVSSSKNDFPRSSLISVTSSSSSKNSVDSQYSNPLESKINGQDSFNKESKEKVDCSRHILFFGPLILCIILLISGIILFIIIGRQNSQTTEKQKQQSYRNKFANPYLSNSDSLFQIFFSTDSNRNLLDHSQIFSCPFVKKEEYSKNKDFALHQLSCSLNHSFVINIYYINNTYPINVADKLIKTDMKNQPIIEINWQFLSTVGYTSFVLILLEPSVLLSTSLYWIRYFSFSSEDECDICQYKQLVSPRLHEQKIILLYATNSTQTMIKAKTICQFDDHSFELIDYVAFLKLQLLASTHFFAQEVDDESEEK